MSITNAFVGYKLFVFRTRGNIIREYFRFYIVYGGSFLINVMLLPLFIGRLKMNVYASQAIITFMTIIGSFLMHKKFTFGGGMNE
jgi:putative flippase GtrA